MKKTLVALAALASVSAFAQSSVEIYGIVDVGYTSHKIDTGAGAADSVTKRSLIGSNGQSTSRVGFRGTEDLGGGTKAGFTFETGLTPAGAQKGGSVTATADTTSTSGAQPNSGSNTLSGFDNRQAFLSLTSAKAGTFSFGRQYSPSHIIQTSYNAGGSNNVVGDVTYTQNEATAVKPGNGISGLRADAVIGTGSTGLTNGAAYKLRFSNSAAWVTPQLAPGLTTAVATVINSTNNNGTDVGAKGGLAVLAKYDNGPLSVGVTTTSVKVQNTSATDVADGITGQGATQSADVKLTDTVLGASYAIADSKIYYSSTNLKLENTALINKRVANKVGVSTTYGAWVPFAQYGTAKTTSDTASNQLKVAGIQLGTSYNFSKRTNAYAIYGQNKATDFSTAGLEKKETQIALGLRHQF